MISKQKLGIGLVCLGLAGALFSGREHLKDYDEVNRLRIELEQQRSNEIHDPNEYDILPTLKVFC